MEGKADRSAQFRTVITLLLDGELHQFEGACSGKITEAPSGAGGFGYDPYFIPTNNNKTFAEMNEKQKLLNSHRYEAFKKLSNQILQDN